MTRAYCDYKPIGVTSDCVWQWRLVKHTGLGKVFLEDWKVDAWLVPVDLKRRLDLELRFGDIFDGGLKGIMGGECLRVAQLIFWVSSDHECSFFGGNAYCHWVGNVESDCKSKGVFWVWESLKGHTTKSEVVMGTEVLLQDL